MRRILLSILSSIAAVLACVAVVLATIPAQADEGSVGEGSEGPNVSNSSLNTDDNPVILIHGWLGDSWNWTYYENRLARDGFADVYGWDYDHTQDNVRTARQLATYVDQVLEETGADKVDLVTHSMGGLGSRYYIKNLGGVDKVDDWVSIGGPNHGTSIAYACFDRSCKDMRPGSAFLTDLNAGDETPGAVDYTTFWSPCDEVINPDRSVRLDGATNHKTGCVGHVSLLADGATYEGMREAIR
ncbi:MAG: triacylglycerol lipase [Nocardioides sp.]|nr:triacylglycerol lipase [Nocardioides sp.]